MKAGLFAGAAGIALLLAGCGAQDGSRTGGNAAGVQEGNAATAGNAAAEAGAADQAGAAGSGGSASGIPCPFTNGNRNWAAWVNRMPGPGAGPTLIVTGEVNASAGYTGRLTHSGLDKSNPPGQHFELTMVEQAGAKAGWRPIRAEVRPANGSGYSSVTIDCHGDQLKVISPIEDAS